MTSDEFKRWSAEHMRRFALDRPDDIDRVAEWAVPFFDARVTYEEADEASRFLQFNSPRMFRPDHPSKLLARIRQRRLELAESRRIAVNVECFGCHGTGFMIVPHPSDWCYGSWNRRHTAAVACNCQEGRKRFEFDKETLSKRHGNRVLLRIEEYEQQFPQWREELARGVMMAAERREAEVAEREAIGNG